MARRIHPPSVQRALRALGRDLGIAHRKRPTAAAKRACSATRPTSPIPDASPSPRRCRWPRRRSTRPARGSAAAPRCRADCRRCARFVGARTRPQGAARRAHGAGLPACRRRRDATGRASLPGRRRTAAGADLPADTPSGRARRVAATGRSGLRRVEPEPGGARAAAGERRFTRRGEAEGERPRRASRLAIAKFTSDAATLPVEKVEVATLRLARATGVNAASARVELGDTDRPVALIERFDRAAGDRIHYLSAQSFLGTESATGASTPTSRMPCARMRSIRAQLAELYRRVLFTILVSNNDDHLKNHGLLHAGGGLWCCPPPSTSTPGRTAGGTWKRASAISAGTRPPSRPRWTPLPSSTSNATPPSPCCRAWCSLSTNSGGRAAGRRA